MLRSKRMWGPLILVNSVLWAFSAVFLVYSFGNAILTWSGKQLMLAILLFAFISIVEIVLAALAEP